MDYLYKIKSEGKSSDSSFIYTVDGMRYACKMKELVYAQFELPFFRDSKKLPVVINESEVKALLNACKLLKHWLIIGLCYGCGLRSSEIQHQQLSHIDLESKLLPFIWVRD